MVEVQHHPSTAVTTSSALTEVTRGYVNLRRSYAEAATRARTETDLAGWHERTSRIRTYWASLDGEDLAEVLDAIAAVHTEQQATNACIPAQIAAPR